MVVEIDEDDLKSGVLGLVVALVEIIKETLRLQAVRLLESGSLTDAEVERLGTPLADLDAAIDGIKVDLGGAESVKAVRDGLDEAAQSIVNSLVPGQGISVW